MNKIQKLAVVVVCGGLVWGLAYAGSVWPDYAMITASFATGVTGLCSMIAGWPAKVNE
jgi:hypothetical protein